MHTAAPKQPKPFKIRDISPLVSPRLAVFPGCQHYAAETLLSFEKGEHLYVSDIHASAHLGAHADAPRHYHPAGATIESRALDFYIGPCDVVTVRAGAQGLVDTAGLRDFLAREDIAPRVLLRTLSFENPNTWSEDFTAIAPDAITALARRGVRLIGVDTPSLDPATSKEMHAHRAVYEQDMAVLEGLVLTDISDGRYFLSAAPLKLEGADAGWVRAVLLEGLA